MNLLMSLMVVLSLVLMTLNHPLSMGLILILQTIMTAMIIGYMIESFLFSYIIIIIMLSGALVLFIYMASVASNEKFKLSLKLSLLSMMMFMFMYIMISYSNKSILFNNNDIDKVSLIKIFNTMTAQMTLMMIIYLLFTMIVVSNIAKVTEGPLRMKN
uniref:NADH-ubiquinone oxidoreductase chain 6 n=1 Tax=Eysarcoris guttigerus TaxID=702485 RepID=A0A6G8QSY3_EYSGU|nr:NADH dehydrogenase subunit 6 [Eysarcoris guttigerus]QIN90467.1 NADH dehydrogenase subunit 6 [Eysarcoris guttigerus]